MKKKYIAPAQKIIAFDLEAVMISVSPDTEVDPGAGLTNKKKQETRTIWDGESSFKTGYDRDIK